MEKKILLALAILSLILVVVLVKKEAFISKDAESEMRPPIELGISFSGEPGLNKPVVLALTADSGVTTSRDAEMEIILPEGIELVDGALRWNGRLSKGEKSTLNVTVKVSKTGNYTIKGQFTDEKEKFENNAVLYIRVTDNSTDVSRLPFDYPISTGNATIDTMTDAAKAE